MAVIPDPPVYELGKLGASKVFISWLVWLKNQVLQLSTLSGFSVTNTDRVIVSDATGTLTTASTTTAQVEGLSGLTATRLVQSDSSSVLDSVSDLTSWVAGTANQITSTSDGDGTLTLALAAAPTLANIMLTSIGGVAIKMTAGETLSKGNVVCLLQAGSAGVAAKVPTTGNELDMPVGVVNSDASVNDAVWVTVAGIAEALPESWITAAIGDVAYCATNEAGRLLQAAGIGTAQHWREVGHWWAGGSGNGALTKIIVHFN